MPDTLKYLSCEWLLEAEKRLNELCNEGLLKTTVSMSNYYLSCPDGKNKYINVVIDDGRLDKIQTGEGEAPAADFTLIADYDVFVQIAREEISGQAALITGKLKIKGNLLKAIQLANLSEKITKILASIPTKY